MKRCVFLDRDGTLVRDPGYVHRLEDFALLPGVPGALRLLADAGLPLVIVTNQSGIGRGRFSSADYEAFQSRLVAELAGCGVPIAASFHCPHAPEADCACRKPRPGLFLRARDELGVDLAASFAVGDSLRDVEAACAAGVRAAFLVTSQAPAPLPKGCEAVPDLAGAARRICALASSG